MEGWDCSLSRFRRSQPCINKQHILPYAVCIAHNERCAFTHELTAGPQHLLYASSPQKQTDLPSSHEPA